MINDVIHNLSIPFPVDHPTRIRVIDTNNNNKSIFKIGDTY